MLAEYCVKAGVTHLRENVQEVEKAENGNIAALKLDKTGRHTVELVVDCTGFRGLIINQALKEPFISYSKYLGNDRAMAVQVPHPDPTSIEPVTRSTALGAGWSWRVPLYSRIGTGYAYPPRPGRFFKWRRRQFLCRGPRRCRLSRASCQRRWRSSPKTSPACFEGFVLDA